MVVAVRWSWEVERSPEVVTVVWFWEVEEKPLLVVTQPWEVLKRSQEVINLHAMMMTNSFKKTER